MPRGRKCRRVCSMPDNCFFAPQKQCYETLELTVEELEAIRLCDLEGLEQDQAAVSMNVSRGTFQRILYQARKKIAEALCNGMAIKISGGNYELAQRPCGCAGRCKTCRFDKEHEESANMSENEK